MVIPSLEGARRRPHLIIRELNERRRIRLAANPTLPLYTLRSEAISPPPPLFQLMKFEAAAAIVLLRLVMMKHQGKTEEDHSIALWFFYATTFCYWLIVGLMKETTITLSREWIQRLHRASLAAALLSTTSLACIFLKYPISLMPLVVFITFSVSFMLLYAFGLFIVWVVHKMHVLLFWTRRVMSSAPTEEEEEEEGEGEGEEGRGGGGELSFCIDFVSVRVDY